MKLFTLGVYVMTASSIWAANLPDTFDIAVLNHYKYWANGKPGREVRLTSRNQKMPENLSVEITSAKGSKKTPCRMDQTGTVYFLLPPDVGVRQDETIDVKIISGHDDLTKTVTVPAMRHWVVYIYPHSHVDIGYTNTQENVELIHKRNIDVALELVEQTANYPKEAQFRWNTEVVWPVERYLASESPERCQKLLNAIKNGYISVDAGYINTNTSACNDEELLRFFSYGKRVEQLTGKPVQTMVQTDIPGMSWGIVAAAAQSGVKYCMALSNGSDRIGFSDEVNFKPFWWVAPDGKTKILFLQPGAYTPGAHAKGKFYWPSIVGQTDPAKLPRVIKTQQPRQHFIDSYLQTMLPRLEKDKDYPYHIFPMTWCLADNMPIDADLPEAIKSWNEEYAYPQLRISTATEILQTYEREYGDKIPVMTGDFTEYWTDGLGSAAQKTGKSREVKDRLVQTEILWSMLYPDKEAPESVFQEAWRHVLLSTEHTWAYMHPAQPLSDVILKTKFAYFDKAEQLTDQLLQETLKGIESPGSDSLAVFNTNPWVRSGLVVLPKPVVDKGWAPVDEAGNQLPIQTLTSGETVFMAQNIPALGSKTYRLQKAQPQPKQVTTPTDSTLTNGLITIKLDPASGDITSMIYNNEEFTNQTNGTGVNSFRYLLGADSMDQAFKPENVQISAKEKGPLVNSLLVESSAKGCNKLTREIRLVQGSAAIDCINVVDKQKIVNKEGIHFGFDFQIPGSTMRYNVPWGVAEVEKDQFKAGNRNWITKQRWLNISNDKKGVTWVSLNTGMFEVGGLTANVIGSATHSPVWIRKLSPGSNIWSWALNNHWHTNFPLTQEGLISFKYRILPNTGTYDVVASNRFGVDSFRPLLAVQVAPNFQQPPSLALAGSEQVLVTNYKTIGTQQSEIHLLSLSEQEETVSLSRGGLSPKDLKLVTHDKTSNVDPKAVKVPAKGMVVLKANW